MVTYYTALGRLVTKEENGTRIPIVIIDNDEFHMSVDELLVWGSLHWNFLNKEDLKKEYDRRKSNAHIFSDDSFEQTLERLEIRQLVNCATDYLAADALYGLIGKLRIIPIKFSVFDKVTSCAYMYFNKGLPLLECIKTFFGTEVTPNEKNVLKLSEKARVTAAEIIKCMEKNIKSIDNEADMMDKLYADDDATEDSIITNSRFSHLKTEVLQAVSNLYLKKKIVFEY